MTFAFDAANQLVSSTCDGVTTRYEYDAAGRMIKEGDKTYTYGYLDKVTSVKDGANVYTYDYHVDGQLAKANYGKDGSEDFTWDGLALIQRGDEHFLNEPHVGGGNPVASSKGTNFFNDMLGTTVGAKSGKQYFAASLSAFGEDLTSRTFQTSRTSQTFFTGKPLVAGLGHAFLMRNYRAGLAKWQSADPMGYPDGWNQMKYGVNNPSSGVDLFGCVWWNPFSWFDGPEERNPYDFYIDEDISIPIDVEPKAFKVYCGAKPTTIKVTVGNSGSFSFKVDLTKIADIILQKLGIEISGLSSPTYTFEIKCGEYTISLPGYQRDSKHHDGTGYMDGVIIAHPVYMREYKLNGEGKKEYLSNQLKYGLLYSFLPVNKTRCE